MGNSNRTFQKEEEVDLWWENGRRRRENATKNALQTTTTTTTSPSTNDDTTDRSFLEQVSDKSVAQRVNHEQPKDVRKKHKENDYSKEISSLHEKRLRIIAEKKKEFDRLRHELVSEKIENQRLREILRANDISIESKLGESSSPKTHDSDGILKRLDRSSLDYLKISELKTENDGLKSRIAELEESFEKNVKTGEENRHLQMEIAKLQMDLQNLNAEMASFEKERHEYNTHVTALKDIIKVSKQLLDIRQNQISQLTTKLEQVEKAASDREIVAFSEDLRQEYEKQLKNIKDLRALYEERQAATNAAKEKYKKELEEAEKQLHEEKAKTSELNTRVKELEEENSEKYDKIANLELNVNIKRAECNELQAQLAVINQLFSEIILGFRNGNEVDMDKLIDVLEENHDLLTNIVVNEESDEVSSTLPKLLLDLINQVNEHEAKTEEEEKKPADEMNDEQEPQNISEEPKNNIPMQSMNSVAEIVKTLPKVWRVLAELLSHQQNPVNELTSGDGQTGENPCYKSVQTPSGTRLVLSVSSTFIRLKDLILEKKSLEKETFRLKQLNTHLETRLQDQEKRLELVCSELSKTWHVVGKMQKQHNHLHTQEKILRYELAQKRKLLTELKEELEYCREKWLQAREKNNKTEMEWKELRNEFASRKTNLNDDLNNSVESGFSDERDISSDDDIYETDTENNKSLAPIGRQMDEADEDVTLTNMIKGETGSVGSCSSTRLFESSTFVEPLTFEETSTLMTTVVPSTLVEPSTLTESSISIETPVLIETSMLVQPSTSIESSVSLETPVLIESSMLAEPSVLTECSNFAESSTPAEASLLMEISTSMEPSVLVEPSMIKETPTSVESSTLVEPLMLLESSMLDEPSTSHVSGGKGSHSNGNVTVKADTVELSDCEWSTGSCVSEFDCTSYLPSTDLRARQAEIEETYKRLESDILLTVVKAQNGGAFTPRSSSTPTELKKENLKIFPSTASELTLAKPQKCEWVKPCCSTSGSDSVPNASNEEKVNRSPSEILATREERLRKLEEQCKQLTFKILSNSYRGCQMYRKLSDLHDKHGSTSSTNEFTSNSSTDSEEEEED